MRRTHALTPVALALLVAACGGAHANAPASTTPQTAPPPAAAPDAGAPPAEPTPAPAAAFAPTAEDRQAWEHAETVLEFNARANFGGGDLRTGFTPDPWSFALSAGGGRSPVDVASLSMKDSTTGEPCGQSFVTRRPDFHFNFTAGTTFPLLRFYVVTDNDADATLVINEPGTGWRCNDDHHHEGWGHPLMPVIDFHNPPAGRYDIWVGTFNQSANNPAHLFVTEVDSNHP